MTEPAFRLAPQQRRLLKHSRTSSMSDLLLGFFSDKPARNEEAEKEVDAEALTAQERVSRMLHTSTPSDRSRLTDGRLFEHFVVVGLSTADALSVPCGGDGGGDGAGVGSPRILYHFPEEREYNIPGVEDFCFPSGCQLQRLDCADDESEILAVRHSQWQDYLRHPEDSYTFLFTAEDGTVYYGACVQKTELLEYGENSLVDMSSLAPDFHATTRRCYCLISRFPFFRLHMDFLYSLFAVEHLDRLQSYAPSIGSDHDELDVFLGKPKEAAEALPTNRLSRSLSQSAGPLQRAGGGMAHGEDDAPARHGLALSMSALPGRSSGDSDQGVADGVDDADRGNGAEAAEAEEAREVGKAAENPSAGPGEKTDDGAGGGERGSPATGRRLGRTSSTSELPHRPEDAAGSPSLHRRSATVHHFEAAPSANAARDSPQRARPERAPGLNGEQDAPAVSAQPVKAALQRYLDQAVPAAGKSIKFKSSQYLNPIEFSRPYFDAEEDLILEWGLPLLFRTLRLKTLLALLRCLLLERKIAIVSPNLRVLSAIVLAFPALIRPFEYQSVTIPILPERMYSMLEAPVPFVVGLTGMPGPDVEHAGDIVFVNVETNEVLCSDPVPQLPRVQELKKQCEPLFRKLAKSFGKGMPYRVPKEQYDLALKLAKVFRSYFGSLFANFHNYTIRDLTDSEKPITVFMKDSFLYDVGEVDFLQPFLESRIFFQYSDKQLRERDENTSGGSDVA